MTKDTSFLIWKSKMDAMIHEHPLQIVTWEATRRCNLHCKHCGSPSEEVRVDNELTTEEVLGAFNQIAEDFDMAKFRHINITGGEPFVRKDLVYILQQLSQKPFYRNIDIQTNSLVLGRKPELLREIKNYGVTGIGVSIDGFRETHEDFRRMQGI